VVVEGTVPQSKRVFKMPVQLWLFGEPRNRARVMAGLRAAGKVLIDPSQPLGGGGGGGAGSASRGDRGGRSPASSSVLSPARLTAKQMEDSIDRLFDGELSSLGGLPAHCGPPACCLLSGRERFVVEGVAGQWAQHAEPGTACSIGMPHAGPHVPCACPAPAELLTQSGPRPRLNAAPEVVSQLYPHQQEVSRHPSQAEVGSQVGRRELCYWAQLHLTHIAFPSYLAPLALPAGTGLDGAEGEQ
jgi:hypothetical protein